ncbi:MAG: hypothetical protein WCG27_05040, partial [Pseudomonadota bacterium]
MKLRNYSSLIIYFSCLLLGSLFSMAWAVNTDPYANTINGFQKCRDLGGTTIINEKVGFALCKLRLENESGPATYALAVFYHGVIFRDRPTYFDDYIGTTVPKVITVGVKINKGNNGSFLSFKMKTRVNGSNKYYGQVVIHTQEKFFNEYSQVSFAK